MVPVKLNEDLHERWSVERMEAQKRVTTMDTLSLNPCSQAMQHQRTRAWGNNGALKGQQKDLR